MSAVTFLDADGAADDDAERRIAPRTKTLKRGKVYFNNMSSTFDCVVRNISATGALLTLDEAAHLPKEFEIRIGEERALRLARLVYRRGVLAGIHFAGPASVEEPAVAKASGPVAESQDADAPTVARMVPAPLPAALVRHFRWA